MFADFSDIINVENIYEEMVLAILMEAVSKGKEMDFTLTFCNRPNSALFGALLSAKERIDYTN